MNVMEIYRSVQGEGTLMGVPTTFVRFFACNLRCAWCFVPDTPVLMADWSWRRLGDLRIGDALLGIERPNTRGSHQRLVKATVEHTSVRLAPTVTVNGEVRCTPDHKFWLTGKNREKRSAVHSGWREVERAVEMRALFVTEPAEPAKQVCQEAYALGYLAGMADGDGTFYTLRKGNGRYKRFRLALREQALLDRFQQYAAQAGFALRESTHTHTGFTGPGVLPCLWLTVSAEADRFQQLLLQNGSCEFWYWGYLGGILDAEGSLSNNALRIAQEKVNQAIRSRIRTVLDTLRITYREEEQGYYLSGAEGERWRILASARPSKLSIINSSYGHTPHFSRVIETVEPTGLVEPVVTLTTSCGSYIAGGYVVKNCDTKYSWSVKEGGTWEDLTPEQVAEQVGALGARHVVLTGGEPTLQRDLGALAGLLKAAGHHLTVETNTTVFPEAAAPLVDLWSLSPKLVSAGRGYLRYPVVERFLAALRPGQQQWKFVVRDDDDEAALRSFLERYPAFAEAALPLVLQPEGDTATPDYPAALGRLAERLRDPFWDRYFARVLPQMHVIVWGRRRWV